jgi:hypothetical protein
MKSGRWFSLLDLNFLQSNSNVAQTNALTGMTFEGARTRVGLRVAILTAPVYMRICGHERLVHSLPLFAICVTTAGRPEGGALLCT